MEKFVGTAGKEQKERGLEVFVLLIFLFILA